MIAPKCEMCGQELQEFGAILLSPPNRDNMVVKEHICVKCYKILYRFLAEHYESCGED